MRPAKLERILAAESDLQPLVAKSRELRALAELAGSFLPPDLSRQVRVANLREGVLVLEAANPSAAAKLKLLGPSLSRFLSVRRWQVSAVSVRVQPNASRTAPAASQKTVQLSALALASLQALHAAMAPSRAREALGDLLERHGAIAPEATLPRQRAGAAGRRRKPRT